jgi:uncharacterized integral membrane protein
MGKLLTIIVILGVILVFTFQNTDEVEVDFWPWKIVVSKALLILASILFGLIAGIVIAIVGRIRGKKSLKVDDPF